MRETMARPRPVPFPDGFVVKNGSKMRSASSRGTPGPESATMILAISIASCPASQRCARSDGGCSMAPSRAIGGATRRRLSQGESRRALEPNDDPPSSVHRVDGVDEQVDEELLEIVTVARNE